MNILPGTITDIDAVLTIVQETVTEMKTYGNNQWDETYPKRDRFIQDVDNQALYIAKDQKNGSTLSNAMGFIVVDNEEPDGYDAMAWRSDRPFLVIHRFAVSIHNRNQGVASALESFACQLAQAQNITYIKVDTHSTNQRMQKFLERKGYIKTGEMIANGKDKPYYCYDKFL
ncbi:MAG: GNAT family N-acetyltransferase [Cyanobacteria bacterium P01_F01_bin.150]